MSYFIYTDLISSLLDPTLIDPGSIWSMLVHITSASTKIFGNLSSFWFDLVAEKFQKNVQNETTKHFSVGKQKLTV